jgi:hypothetical protein
VFWEITRNDIQETLKHVCKKVLHDHSVSEATRATRARGMVLLGEMYVLKRVREMDGLADFLDRVGKQTGLFDESAQFQDPFKKEEKEGEGEGGTGGMGGMGGGGKGYGEGDESFFSDALSKEVLAEMLSSCESLSIRELKENIALLGGDPTACLEKGDLQTQLRDLLMGRLAEDEPKTGAA